MLSIRCGTVNDVPLLKTLIEEFATYERLPTVIAEEQLRQDGFGTRPKFQILIAEIDGSPAGYALFFDYYSSFQGPGIFLEDLLFDHGFVGRVLGGRCWRVLPELRKKLTASELCSTFSIGTLERSSSIEK